MITTTKILIVVALLAIAGAFFWLQRPATIRADCQTSPDQLRTGPAYRADFYAACLHRAGLER